MLSDKLTDLYRSLSITRKNSLKMSFASLMRLPLVRDVYHYIYSLVIRKGSPELPKAIVIETYNICNLKCIMCPYPVMTRKKERMGMGLFRKIIDDASRSGFKELCLNGYNEPLLDASIFERIEYAKSKGMTIRCVSNGTLLNKRDNINRIIESGLDRICFSIDGADKRTYERIRVGAQFEDVVNGINELIRKKREMNSESPKIEINCTLQKENYRQLSKGGEKLRSLFKGANLIELTPVDFRASKREHVPLSWGSSSAKFAYPCRRIWRELFVLSDGSVSLCCMDSDGSIRLGSLKDSTIKKVWNSRRFKEIRRLHLAGKGRSIKLCGKCDELNAALFRWWMVAK